MMGHAHKPDEGPCNAQEWKVFAAAAADCAACSWTVGISWSGSISPSLSSSFSSSSNTDSSA
eukprot:4043503-Amphidinium_carterae.1